MTADPAALDVAVDDGVAWLTMNRPERHNALSRGLRIELVAALRHLAGRDDVHAIVLTGAGEKAFCAGLDLSELESGSPPIGELGPDAPMLRAFAELPQPVIAAINGAAITGGLELALLCDVRVASSSARFADTHARVGVVPGWGLSQRLTGVIGPTRARYLHYTGNFVDALTARDWGLVLDVLSPDGLHAHCDRMARQMAGCDAAALRDVVVATRLATENAIAAGLREEAVLAVRSMERLDVARLSRERSALQARGRQQAAEQAAEQAARGA